MCRPGRVRDERQHRGYPQGGPGTDRILPGHVGGSFGMKAAPFPEYVCVLHAARVLGRPVKWTDERSGSFLSDSHGRDNEVTAELALDAQGNFLAVRLTIFGNMGAFLSPVAPISATANAVKDVPGAYRTPLLRSRQSAFSPTRPRCPAYRTGGPRAITTWSGWLTSQPARWASTASSTPQAQSDQAARGEFTQDCIRVHL